MLRKNGTTELRMETLSLPSADLGPESSLPDLLGENILQNQLIFCLDEDDEIFEGYGRQENVYPYRQYNTYGKDLKHRQVKTFVLENNYLKAVFLPEYGGRLWSLFDKQAGKDLLYKNDVLQFRNLAVRNAWFSGGVEWNIGVIGHSPFTTAPLYAAALQDKNGTPILRMYEYERIRSVYYQMDFWLEENDRALNCRMRIVNEQEQVVPMYWWSNIAVPEHEDGRILVPAEKAYTFADGKVFKVDIPIVDGVDITRYHDIPLSVDYFFDIEDSSPKYIAHVDQDGYGLLQLSTSRLRSRKLFSWGHNRASRHWQEFLTKDGGNYLEIQAGLAKTQYGCIPMAPHTAWEWMEQYGPIQLSDEQMASPHKTASCLLTQQLIQEKRISNLEQKLKDTKELAKTKGELLQSGSGYGAFTPPKSSAKHLAFRLEDSGLKQWHHFLQTGLLHEPSPLTPPDAFWNSDEIFTRLQETIESKNSHNWYAHYQLGVCLFNRKSHKKARKEWKASYALQPNPWTCHGLGCSYYADGKKDKAVSWILKGIKQRSQDASYLKECFKLLHLCQAYPEIIQCYETLPGSPANRLTFYYIYANAQLGQTRKALFLLEKDGGLVMEDIREGEDSLEQLWTDLHKAVAGTEDEVPFPFVFKAF